MCVARKGEVKIKSIFFTFVNLAFLLLLSLLLKHVVHVIFRKL